MKHLLISSLICMLCHPLFAQVASQDKVMSTSSNIREKLVELALQNPDLEVADHQVQIAKYNLKEAKGWWASNISLSFNANEFTVKRLEGKNQQEDGRYYPYYPIYNVGMSIPIGGLFSKPAATKAAREKVNMAQAERDSKYREIRASVLTAYENYLSRKRLYTIQSQITESAYNDYLQTKEKFRNGQTTVADYNISSDQYYKALKERIGAENEFNLTRIELETLIGVPVSQVLTDMGTTDAPTDSTAVQ